MDFYLSPKGSAHISDIYAVASQPPSERTDALLLGYAMEGIRLAGTFGLYREAAADDTIYEDDERQVPVNKGDKVFVSFVSRILYICLVM